MPRKGPQTASTTSVLATETLFAIFLKRFESNHSRETRIVKTYPLGCVMPYLADISNISFVRSSCGNNPRANKVNNALAFANPLICTSDLSFRVWSSVPPWLTMNENFVFAFAHLFHLILEFGIESNQGSNWCNFIFEIWQSTVDIFGELS